MQQNWDDFDKIIGDSNKDIEPRVNYNQILMSKIKERSISKSENRIAALSLITAGFILIFIQVTDLQSNIINAEYQVKTGITLLKNDSTISNLFKECDYRGKKE